MEKTVWSLGWKAAWSFFLSFFNAFFAFLLFPMFFLVFFLWIFLTWFVKLLPGFQDYLCFVSFFVSLTFKLQNVSSVRIYIVDISSVFCLSLSLFYLPNHFFLLIISPFWLFNHPFIHLSIIIFRFWMNQFSYIFNRIINKWLFIRLNSDN